MFWIEENGRLLSREEIEMEYGPMPYLKSGRYYAQLRNRHIYTFMQDINRPIEFDYRTRTARIK